MLRRIEILKRDIHIEFGKGIRKNIALACVDKGVQHISTLKHDTNHLSHHDIAKSMRDECYKYMIDNYNGTAKAAGSILPDIIFWMIVRNVVWWLAKKIVDRWLDEMISSG